MISSTQETASKTTDNTEETMIEQDVGYVRLSKREQAEDTHALEQQRARVLAAGAKRLFEDIQNGTKDERPDFQKLLSLVKRGKIRKITITRIDRISRSLITLKNLINTLNEYGVILVILDQNIDMGTAQGRLLFNVLGTLAEWEVDLLSERIQHGKKHQRAQKWANGQCPWGYKVVKHQYRLDPLPFLCLLNDRPANYQELSRVEIAPDTVEQSGLLPGRTLSELARDCIDIFFEKKGVRRALKVIFEKYGIAKTSAKHTGTDKIFHWTTQGFAFWLTNPVLAGHTCYLRSVTVGGKRKPLPEDEWQIIPNTHPDQRLFRDGEAEVVKATIRGNISGGGGFKKSSTGSENYCRFAYQSGLIYCDECRSRCTSKGSKGKYEEYLYYACRHPRLGCTNSKSVKRRHIEEALIEALVEESQRYEQGSGTAIKTPAVLPEAVLQLEIQLAALEKISGFNPDINDLKQKLQQQIEQEKNPFASEDKLLDSSAADLIRAGNNLAIWHLLNNDEKVEIYRKLVHKIYIRDGKVVSIVFNQ